MNKQVKTLNRPKEEDFMSLSLIEMKAVTREEKTA